MSNGQKSPAWPFRFVPNPTQWAVEWASKQDANVPIRSALDEVLLDETGDYAYTGDDNVEWFLPPLSSGKTPFDVTNMGSGNVTVFPDDDTDPIFNLALVDEVTIPPGFTCRFVNFAVVWKAEYLSIGGGAQPSPIISAAATLNLGSAAPYLYTGAGNATWTLPALGSGLGPYSLKNMTSASGILTIECTGIEEVYGPNGLIDTFDLFPGSSIPSLENGVTAWAMMGSP